MSTNQSEWLKLTDHGSVDSPALLVFPHRVEQNITTAIEMIGDVSRLRPHIKTVKSAEPVKLMMARGIKKFKCATISEAELLAVAGAKDILLAYQPLGPKMQRLILLASKYPDIQFSFLTDNIPAAEQQSEKLYEAGLKMHVYIDLNVGMNRTGIVPGDEAMKLFEYCYQAGSFAGVGLHAYDGHIRDVEFEKKKKRCDEVYDYVSAFRKSLENAGLKVFSIVMGGSPGFSVHCKRKDIECSPGTFVYWDQGYSEICPEQNFKPAVALATRIISFPSPGKLCTDLGHKSVASENEISRRVFFPGHDFKPLSQSEEHLVLSADGHDHKIGDLLYGIPYHVCPTIALYERALTCENGRITGEWKNVARDRMLTT